MQCGRRDKKIGIADCLPTTTQLAANHAVPFDDGPVGQQQSLTFDNGSYCAKGNALVGRIQRLAAGSIIP